MLFFVSEVPLYSLGGLTIRVGCGEEQAACLPPHLSLSRSLARTFLISLAISLSDPLYLARSLSLSDSLSLTLSPSLNLSLFDSLSLSLSLSLSPFFSLSLFLWVSSEQQRVGVAPPLRGWLARLVTG